VHRESERGAGTRPARTFVRDPTIVPTQAVDLVADRNEATTAAPYRPATAPNRSASPVRRSDIARRPSARSSIVRPGESLGSTRLRRPGLANPALVLERRDHPCVFRLARICRSRFGSGTAPRCLRSRRDSSWDLCRSGGSRIHLATSVSQLPRPSLGRARSTTAANPDEGQ